MSIKQSLKQTTKKPAKFKIMPYLVIKQDKVYLKITQG